MRRADQINNRARDKRSQQAAFKRAKRLKVAREHSAGRKFRMRLADKVDRPLAKAIAGKRAAVANAMLAAKGYARIFKEAR